MRGPDTATFQVRVLGFLSSARVIFGSPEGKEGTCNFIERKWIALLSSEPPVRMEVNHELMPFAGWPLGGAT